MPSSAVLDGGNRGVAPRRIRHLPVSRPIAAFRPPQAHSSLELSQRLQARTSLDMTTSRPAQGIVSEFIQQFY